MSNKKVSYLHAFTFLLAHYTIRTFDNMYCYHIICRIGIRNDASPLPLCKYFEPNFNIMSACLIHKHAIDLHLTDSCEKFIMNRYRTPYVTLRNDTRGF